tara:strand:+ start:3779 stop:3985 length:207 start_codon:yes stop_codon:yes gene_type:complete
MPRRFIALRAVSALVCQMGGQCIADILLVDISDGYAAQLGQDVQFERRIPTARLAVAFQFRFARIEGV